MANINKQTTDNLDDAAEWYAEMPTIPDIRASRGQVKDTSVAPDSDSKTQDRKSVYELYLEMSLADPIISTAFDTTVDVATRNGFRLVPKPGKDKSEKEIQKANSKLYDELDTETAIDSIFYSMLTYGNSFTEKRKNGSQTVNELWPLESTEMSLKYDKHGKILGYVQHSADNKIPFKAEEVVFIPLKKFGSRVESYEPLEPIAEIFATSRYAHSYLNNVFLNLPPKYLYVLQGGSEAQRKKLIGQIKLAKRDPKVDIVTQIQRDNALKVETLQPNFDEALLKILEYAREQVLLVTRVPPVWVGLVNNDGANRGNSEAQITSFETRIRKLQRKVESAFDKQLLPDLGLEDFQFKFNAISIKNEKQIIENARQFKDMGLDGDSVIQYLRDNGVSLRDGAEFEEPEEMEMIPGTPKDKDLMPSRVREDKQTDDISSNLDSSGVSSASGKKMGVE